MTVRRLPLALAALSLTAAAAWAQMPALPGVADKSRVTAGTYQADPGHTLVGWRVDHFGFTDYFGLFGDIAGTLVLDPANPAAARVDVTIPIDPTVASKGLRDHLLRGGKDGKPADFFGPDPQPARFVSRTVTVGADGMTAVIVGDLTLNGRTAPVALQARFNGAGANPMNKKETVGFQATGVLKRSQFGIAYGIPMVSDEVELDISAAFEKSGGAAPAQRPVEGACNAGKAQPWIGKKATPAVRSAVAKATGAKSIRWLYPDSVMTMDYRQDRLNVRLEPRSDIIRSANCG